MEHSGIVALHVTFDVEESQARFCSFLCGRRLAHICSRRRSDVARLGKAAVGDTTLWGIYGGPGNLVLFKETEANSQLARW